MRIKVTKDGPYQVTGQVPIREEIITPVRHHNEYRPGDAVTPEKADEYYLCRCGHSGHAPFCDGTHQKIGFVGTETADRAPYVQRATDITEGTTMRLLDDGRCAFARFCHRDEGEVWTLTTEDADPRLRKEALIAAAECPAGRLVEESKDGKPLEQPLSPEVVILQDPVEHVSAEIAVRGPIELVAVDGTAYEQRNRIALCRCGQSSNKPFCDASHINAGYNDGRHGPRVVTPVPDATGPPAELKDARMAKAKPFEEYFSEGTYEPHKLERLRLTRELAHELYPEVEERVGWAMPGFYPKGATKSNQQLFMVMANDRWLGLYGTFGMGDATLTQFEKLGVKAGKGSLQVPYDLPVDEFKELLRRVVNYNLERQGFDVD